MINSVNGFKTLFDEGWSGFKGYYFNNTQRVFEKHYKPLGKWLPKIDDPTKYGIYKKEGIWDDFNRINTHPKIAHYLYNKIIEKEPNLFTNFGDPKYHESNVKLFWDYLDENFELFFTENITSEHYYTLYKYLDSSWTNGNISVILALLELNNLYPKNTFEYDFNTGGIKDMKGFDIIMNDKNGKETTFQVKSGSFNENEKYNNLIFLKGSHNDLSYTCDYYIYSSLKFKDNDSSFIMFKNEPPLKRTKFNDLMIKTDSVIHKIKKPMTIPEKISEISVYCGQKNISFNIMKDEKHNRTEYVENNDEKKFTIYFSNMIDLKDFEKILNDDFEKLKTS